MVVSQHLADVPGHKQAFSNFLNKNKNWILTFAIIQNASFLKQNWNQFTNERQNSKGETLKCWSIRIMTMLSSYKR